MMHKLFLALAMLTLCAPFVAAQDDDDSRSEFFIGYSNLQADTTLSNDSLTDDFDDFDFNDFGLDERESLHGVNASVTGYLTRRFGLTGDFAFHQKTSRLEIPAETGITSGGEVRVRDQRFTILGGPTFKFKNDSRVEPFVRAMAGVAITRGRFDATSVTGGNIGGGLEDFDAFINNFSDSTTDFALGIGGGIDVDITDKVAIRAIQVDYNPVFLRDRSFRFDNQTINVNGQRLDNLRFSFGVVFK